MKTIKDYTVHSHECDLLKPHTGTISCSCGLQEALDDEKSKDDKLQDKLSKYYQLSFLDNSFQKTQLATELIADFAIRLHLHTY